MADQRRRIGAQSVKSDVAEKLAYTRPHNEGHEDTIKSGCEKPYFR